MIFEYGDFVLEYYRHGTGKTPMLTFHGFGRTGEDFKAFDDTLGLEYEMYSFNFFHHGNSIYPANRVERDTLTKHDVKLIFNAFLKQQQIERFALLGYSMGGKMALTLLELFPNQVESVYLFGPDGIKSNHWYYFVSHTHVGKWIYKKILRKPELFFKSADLLKNLRLLNPRLHKFTLMQMENPEKRMLVFNVWMTLRSLIPNLKKIKQAIITHRIRVRMFYGKHDTIIPQKVGNKLLIGMPKELVSSTLLDSGHVMITPKTNEAFKENPTWWKG